MKISIITATYNSAATVRDTFESVLSQSYKDIEYIVVDGGSKDKTLDIIKEYEPRFKGRMTWKSEPDKGIYDAMNKGIQRATGDVVGILNSDDYYTSDSVVLEIACTFNKKLDETDAVYGDIHFIHQKNPSKNVRYYSSKWFRPYMFRFGFMPAHPSFYVKREKYLNLGVYDTTYKIASDYDLLIRFLYKEKIKSTYIPIDMVTMRIGGISTKSFRSRVVLNQEIIRACKFYGIWTSMPLLLLKYLIKVFELK